MQYLPGRETYYVTGECGNVNIETEASKPKKILDRLHDIMRVRRYSLRTEKISRTWIIRCVRFHEMMHQTDYAGQAGVTGSKRV
ncbi:MAG: hypothetical protein R6V03_02400 [Kiritimatiellia bacterium]